MPKRTDIATVLIIGAGPIVIGAGVRVRLLRRAGVQGAAGGGLPDRAGQLQPGHDHDRPELADATYIEPITPEIVAKVIARERHVVPGGFALLPTMGGQTALNTALALEREGVLARFDVEMIGARAEVIDKAEDRQKFRDAMDAIGLESPVSRAVHTLEAGVAAIEVVGLPAVIRPSFTLAGTGGGIAYNMEEVREIVERGLDLSPTTEVLIEESVLGWKEYEMEVVRDRNDNCIIVCSIENIDPMGVHTGDSVTVAPALTLTDKEYQRMRSASIAVLREIGVETGGSNVQFAVNPADGRHGGDRDEPARVAQFGAGLQGHGLPDRQGRRPSGGGLHAGRAQQRHHRRHPRGLRAGHRLCGGQDPALRLRKVSGRRAAPDHQHEERRRGHGHGPHLRRGAAEGAAGAGDRPLRPGRHRHSGERTTRTPPAAPCCAPWAVPRPTACA